MARFIGRAYTPAMVQRVSVLAVLLLVCIWGVAPGAAHATPTWVDPVGPLSAAGQSANYPDVAIDGAGNVVSVWDRSDGSFQRVEAAFRPAGGTFTEPVPISDAGATAWFARVAVDPTGNAMAVWGRADGADFRIQAAFRPVGGAFAPAKTLSAAGENGGFPQVAFDGAGNAIVAWVASGASTSVMRAAYRPAGGDFEPATAISSAGSLSNQFHLLFDARGNAAVAWPRQISVDSSAVEAALRPAGGTFQPAIPVSGLHKSVGSVRAAFEPGGGLQVVYTTYDPPPGSPGRSRIETARRAPGAAFGTPQDLTATSGATTATVFPDIAIDRDGHALATWMEGFYIWVASRPSGTEPFASAVRISPDHGNTYEPHVRFDPAGDAIIVWPEQWANDTGSATLGWFVTAMVRRAGSATFTGRRKVSPDLGGNGLYTDYAVSMNALSDGVAVWEQFDGSKYRVGAAGLDGAPPVLPGLSAPAAGFVGTALPFSVDAIDVWSPVSSVAWAFGDGATASGAQVSHAYTAPGTYGATVTATDALGNAASGTGTVSIAPAPVPVPGRPITAPDRTAPALTALKLTPARFRAAQRGASLAATAVGTTVRFTLSEAASVRFTVERTTVGRRVGRSCRRVTAQNRRRARCTRYVAVKGSATRKAIKGATSVKFRGRLGGRRLAPGRYRLILRATDAAGNRSAVRRAGFRIVRR